MERACGSLTALEVTSAKMARWSGPRLCFPPDLAAARLLPDKCIWAGAVCRSSAGTGACAIEALSAPTLEQCQRPSQGCCPGRPWDSHSPLAGLWCEAAAHTNALAPLSMGQDTHQTFCPAFSHPRPGAHLIWDVAVLRLR